MNLEKSKVVLFVCAVIIIVLVSLLGVRLLGVGRLHGEEYKALAEKILSDSREEFEIIRGISVRDVVLEVVNESWVLENWGEPYADREELQVDENIYKALFMISQDVSLYDEKLEWTGMLHAAKWQGKIYVVEEKFDITDEKSATSTFVHELTHVMQENYSLPSTSTFDGSKALTSLKEGDATLMADTFKNDGVVPISYSISGKKKQNLSAPIELLSEDEIQLDLPYTLDEINRFPYHYGIEFVKALYSQGGWEAVNDAYSKPPTTTEQIMHPEKYFTQETAIHVESVSVPAGWNIEKSDRFGEFFIFIMLNEWLSTEDAEVAADGWGGDILNYYKNDEQFLFTWNIVWDSEDDAHDFYLTFQDMLSKVSAEKNNSFWSAYGRYISIQWNKNSTLIVSSDDKILVQQPVL